MISADLIKKCELFSDNYHQLRKSFKWEYASMQCLGAYIYAKDGLTVNVEAIKNSKEIIKNNTGIFSSFKNTAFFALAVMLSQEENPMEVFKNTLSVYEDMKKAGFHSSVYLSLAALAIAQQSREDAGDTIRRAKEFYNRMKENHWFLTSADDYGYAAILGAADLPIDSSVMEMEKCYDLLKPDFGAGNALQSLTHVLTIGEESAESKCFRAKQIYDNLIKKGCKLSKYQELASLGILVLISEDVEKITDEIKEVYDLLMEKKGFGKWSMTKHERTMYAASLVAAEYVKAIKKENISLTLANSITNIVTAQQTAMIIAASSAAGAAAASSSGS